MSNSLDDIFGSSPTERDPIRPDPSEPSDLPSLRRQHVTAGYRDGTSTSKGLHVQDGFDAGFPIGAQMGMRAGTVLGIMEGLLRGFEERGGAVKKPGSAAESDEERAELRRQKREQIRVLYQAAVKELDVQAVFSGGDGATEVVPAGRGEEKAEVQLAVKGDPVIAKWEGVAKVPRWEENMEALEMKEKEKKEMDQGQDEAIKGGQVEQS
ncbi:unnamed protein product [Penicillium salamii]|uniref:Protein YAE1 n=1 Tax=Penicillium salamii TaxID=1612424 RepID=A0A9W4N6C8_9EURO|nr:unnamed protein product [Penicillium salamii]CAG8246741.1 unnamed protein product [Penicillium salamii]CAG8269801.1 unnamed protein product [Penicillium salamii]CAG8422986.1 unnamed protein product [Penicillium salamii]